MENSKIRLLGHGTYDVPPNIGKIPTRIIAVEVGADLGKRNLNIDYVWGSDSNYVATDLPVILVSVAKGESTYLRKIKTRKERMSLNVKEISVIIFRLSDDIDWQFSYDRSPISLSEESMKTTTYDQDGSPKEFFFGNAHRILENGTVDLDPKTDNCNVACLICDGAGLTRPSGSYKLSINLHVDLLDRDRGGNIIGRLPIVIDPDVKNPGGSEP